MASMVGPPLPVSRLGRDHPFPGLRPFEEEDAAWFFARGQEINDLLKRLRRVRFLAVVGPSGCGKSSLVKAGLLAAVRDGYLDAKWRVATFRPDEQPVRNLAKAVAETADPQEVDRTLQLLNCGPKGLVDAVGKQRRSEETNVLLVVDQFEELFQFVQRQGESAQEQAKAFLKLLLTAAASDEAPVYVVLTMRLEWLNECATYTGLAEAINEGIYLVPQMSRRQFQQTILNPIEAAQGRITTALLDRMLNDLDGRTDQLPVLEHALMRMWGRCSAGEALDVPAYTNVGTLASCLSDHAEEIFTKKLNAREQQAAERLFRSITQVSKNRKVRRPRPLGEIADEWGEGLTELKAVTEALRLEGRSFLVTTPGELTTASIIDLSHEALIRQWERLEKWVEDEAEVQARIGRLEEIAAEWERSRRKDKSILYRGSALQKAQELRSRLKAGSVGIAFLQASKTAERWNQFLLRGSMASILVVLIAAAVGWGLYFMREAQQAREQKDQLDSEVARQAVKNTQYQNWVAKQLTQGAIEPKARNALARTLLGKRVYLQCMDEGQVPLIKQLQTQIAKEGYTVPGWEKVGSKAPKLTEVRYFYPSDRTDAINVAALLGTLVEGGATIKLIATQNSLVPLGQLEVWLSPSAVAAK